MTDYSKITALYSRLSVGDEAGEFDKIRSENFRKPVGADSISACKAGSR